MTAAKEMNVIARLPDCAGQAADAVSACTQVKMEDVPKLQKHPKKIPSESVQIYGYVFHDTSGQNLGQTLKTQCFLLNEICTDIHLLASFWEDGSWKFYWDVDRKKYQIGNVCVCIESRDYSFPHTWMTKKDRRQQNMDPMWKNGSNLSILESQHPFLTTCIWEVVNVNANRTKL